MNNRSSHVDVVVVGAGFAGYVVDLGGQWAGSNQTHLLNLAEAFGVKVYPQYVGGEHILDVKGREGRYKQGEDLPLEPADLAEFNRLMGVIEENGRRNIGYLDGAIQSGERGAGEIAKQLRP